MPAEVPEDPHGAVRGALSQPSPCTPITSTQSLHLPKSFLSHLQNGIKTTTFSHHACDFPELDLPLKAGRTLRAGQAPVSWLPFQPPALRTKQRAPLCQVPPAGRVPVSLSVSSGLPTPRTEWLLDKVMVIYADPPVSALGGWR